MIQIRRGLSFVDPLSVTVDGETVNVNDALAIERDIEADNDWIHAVDRVIMLDR